MAKDKNKNAKPTPDGRHLLRVALPVAIVLGVLIVGAVLQSDPSPDTNPPLARNQDPPLPPPSANESSSWSDSDQDDNPLEVESGGAAVETSATVPSTDRLSDLARRVMEDVDRLESTGDDWTSQIGVFCDDERVSELVGRHGDRAELFVLPVLLDDRPCFRICWGHYTTHDQAAQARDLPAALRGDPSLPRRISTVTEE